MQAVKKPQILKFLKDYCYAIYLGVFGAYLAGVWGFLIIGAIGLFYDYRIGKEKFYSKYLPKKETFLGSRKLREKLNRLEHWRPVYKYGMWLFWSVVWSIVFTYIVTIHGVLFGLRDTLYKGIENPNFWDSPFGNITLKVSNIIYYISEYIAHMDRHAKNFLEKPEASELLVSFSAQIFVCIWILCIIRSPGLFRYINNLSKFIMNYFANKNLRRSLVIFFIMLFGFVFYQVIIGGKIMFPENQNEIKIVYRLMVILVPSTFILLAVIIAVIKTLPFKFKTRSTKREAISHV